MLSIFWHAQVYIINVVLEVKLRKGGKMKGLKEGVSEGERG